MGRPSSFTQTIADDICERLANGESLRAICAGEAYPKQATVFRWLAANDEFREQYARAREAQADTLADEIIDIADETAFDTKVNEAGNEVPNSEWISRSKLRVDARKWVAAKLKPKVYGDKLDLTSAGDKLAGPTSEVDLATRMAALAASMNRSTDAAD